MERMFKLFDSDGDGMVNFEEFIKGLSVFCPTGTLDEKLECECVRTHGV